MKHMMWTLLLMITVGIGGFMAGKHAQMSTGPEGVHLSQMEPPHVVLAKSATRQPKEARQESEGCPLVPYGDAGQQKDNTRDDVTMKGLVF